MPKSSRRKRKAATVPARVQDALSAQLDAFRKKFGRDPRPGEPIIFDPDADVPTSMSPVKFQADMLEAMRKAGTPPAFIYAYRKCGFLLTESSKDHAPPDQLQEWNDAIDEYYAIEHATTANAEPHPQGWRTEIPELLTSDFSEADYAHVRECLKAMAPVEGGRPMKLVSRIELTAACLATTCSHAFDSAHETGSPERAFELFEKAVELVVRRARELYAQGPAS
jgi:hypothetical protein